MTATSVFGFSFADDNDYRHLFYAFLITPLILLLAEGFKRESLKVHKRDFYLFLRGSKEIDNAPFFPENPHIRLSDKVFSFTLLILILGLTFFGAVLFGKENLYGQWMHG